MPDRIKPAEGMVLQYFENTGPDEVPCGARITRVISDTEADIEFYRDGATNHSSEVPVLHPLDGAPADKKPFARFLPRHDVASERHLLHSDKSATEGEPQHGDGPDSRVLPTTEHVSEEDPVARGKMGLPAEKTDDERTKEKAAGVPSVKDEAKEKSKSEEKRHAAKGPDSSLKRK
jgi:hypothetical protein